MDQAALDTEITTDLAPAAQAILSTVTSLEAKLDAASPTQPISTLDLSSEIGKLKAFATAFNAAAASATAAPAPVSDATTTAPETAPAPAATETAATPEPAAAAS